MMESMSTMKGENFSDSGISFLVIRKEYWERALSQAQQDHERKESIQQDVHGENQNTFEEVKVKVPPKPYEPTKEERQSHEATHCPFRAWCEICVKARSPDGKHAKQVGNPEHIPVVDFNYAYATDALGDPIRRISMIVATDSIHGSIYAVVARRKGGQDDYVTQSCQKYIDRLGLAKAELKCDKEPSTLDVANALIKRCQSTALIATATPKGSNGSLGRGERANLTIQGELRAFREAVSRQYKTEVGLDHVLMGWTVRHCAWVVNNFQVKGTGKAPYRSIWGKDCTGEVVPLGEVCMERNHSEDGAKLNMRWMRRVFVGKLDRTDDFLLLTPTDAIKTRCVRRLDVLKVI